MIETLTVTNLSAGYNQRAVITEITLSVASGEIVILSGANGVGKSTLLSCIGGRIEALTGSVSVGEELLRTGLEGRARKGITLVPEERLIFRSLTVKENLRMSGRGAMELLAVFPELDPHMDRRAGLLSGGQQQMLSLAVALGCHPKFLLIDELTLGLAPIVVNRLLDSLRLVVSSEGVGVLLVEQHIRRALLIADRGYVLAAGQIAMSGSAAYLTAHMDEIETAYLGGPAIHPEKSRTTS